MSRAAPKRARAKPEPEPDPRIVEKARRIAALLDEHWPEPPVPLDHSDPFTLLVAVMLSAQTTDVRVNQVTPALFARAPDARTMATLTPDEILSYIKTCGLAPTKAKNLQKLAQQLVDLHGGEVPADLEALEALPGVGHKTASVVMSQAFGVPAFPVDTHIFRNARRWGLSSGKDVEAVEADLRRLFPPESWSRLHLQIIWFGRVTCTARAHDGAACVICSWAADPAHAG